MEKYHNLIQELINKFIETIPSDFIDKDNLINGFKKYLENEIQSKLMMNLNEKDQEKFITFWLNIEANNIIKMNIDNKQSMLLEDINYQKIKELSNELYNKALNKLKDNNMFISKEEYDNIKKTFDALYQNTKPYNQEKAKNDISEGLLDANYLLDDKTDAISLRLGHQFQSINRKD